MPPATQLTLMQQSCGSGGAATKIPLTPNTCTQQPHGRSLGAAVFTDGEPGEICLSRWQRLRVVCKRR